MRERFVVFLALVAACTTQAREDASAAPDSARRAFADTVAALVLDTTLFELRGHLFVKIENPNKDDESPLVDREVPHPSSPGPHTMDGKLYADLEALRQLLGRDAPVRVDTARDHVFVGNPPVLLVSHQHGDAMYVPVKLFARQFGAYTDIGCTLANCGHIWPRDVIEFMRSQGAIGGAGILEGHAEGIVRDVDVTRLPTG
ncbi:MAG: hypothetical protein ACREOK_08875 [Gemmatimonadaceae bacterium]